MLEVSGRRVGRLIGTIRSANPGMFLLCISVLEIWFLLLLPFVDEVRFGNMGIFWLHESLFDDAGPGYHRFFARLLNRWLFFIFGFSREGFALLALLLHLFNGLLIYLLARHLRAPRFAAVAAVLFFAGNPVLLPAIGRMGFLLEIPLLTGFLGVSIGYIRRSRANTCMVKAAWLIVETISVWVCAGSKESFVVYPLLLVALELGEVLTIKEGMSSASHVGRVLKRLSPHVLLYGFLLLQIHPFSMLTRYMHDSAHAMNFSPLHLIRRLDGFVVESMLLGRLAGETPVLPAGTGLAAYTILVAMAVVKRRSHPTLTVGFLFMSILMLPVLPFEERLEPPYIYHPWAGLALAGSALFVGTSRRRPAHVPRSVIAVAYVLLVATKMSSITDANQQAPDFSENLRREVANGSVSICRQTPLQWDIPSRVWESICRWNPRCREVQESGGVQPIPRQVLDRNGLYVFRVLGIMCGSPDWSIRIMP